MRDVANRAHVSVRTVSRVINGQGEITEATRQRVLATIDEMDYRPSKLARGLVSRHTDTIGLIVGDIANPFFSEIARAMQDKARAAGYDVFFCNSGGSWEEELRALHSLADHGVDGIVISPSPGLTAERIKPFADRSCPIVAVAHAVTHPRISSIVVATRTGARHAVEYLIDKGHTCIGMLAGPAPSPTTSISRSGLPGGTVITGDSLPIRTCGIRHADFRARAHLGSGPADPLPRHHSYLCLQ